MKLQKSKSLLTTILTSIIIISIFIGIFLIVLHIQNKHYIKIINAKINLIVNTVVKNYPDVNEEDILKILNTQSNYGEDILKKYGYDNEVSNIKELQEEMNRSKTQDLILISLFGLLSLSAYLVYVASQERKIKEINEYIDQINNKNYTLKIKNEETLNINAITEDATAKVRIVGNNNLNNNNVIKIIVTAEDKSVSTYSITVSKEKSINYLLITVIIETVVIIGIILFLVLRKKKSDVNEEV